jgi:co-chaperonin GroES (HSP10)
MANPKKDRCIIFKPLHSLVTVVLDPKKDRTDGGLVIPEVCEAAYRTGVVRAVGTGPLLDHPIRFDSDDGESMEYEFYAGLPVAPGDRVVIGIQKQNGRAANLGGLIDDDGIEIVLVNIQDIWGIIDKAPANPLTVN